MEIKKRGKLTVIGGPMFAGKTTRIQEAVKQIPKDQVVAVKPSIDDRYIKNRIVNHDEATDAENELVGISAVLVDRNNPNLRSLISSLISLLAIDETNFFEFEVLWPEISEIINSGTNVVAAGLIYDIFDNEFGATKKLAERADEYIELTANCTTCGRPARHTRSLENRKPGDPIIVVGGSDKYYVSCDRCISQ